ncbi:MAG: hypothetical protein FVQ81_14620 [Candidatus Glassbacteria bacterium]|nr:hypothetical protein [Candidatus Glassbacteria bacterium]
MIVDREKQNATEGATVHFGEFLVGKGMIEPEQRDNALAIQEAVNHKLGIMATMDEILTVSQVYTILDEQRRTGRPFGQAARRLNLIDDKYLIKLLDRQNKLRLRVGEILVGLGYLEHDRMEAALDEFQRDFCQKK